MPELSRHRRRRARLHDELIDERVPLHLDGPFGQALIEEIDHAHYPPVHEQHVATYGAFLYDNQPSHATTDSTSEARIVDLAEVPWPVARRLADGRGSFLARSIDPDTRWLVCWPHSIEYEAHLVEFVRRTGGHVVQRTARGDVKIVSPDTVVVWDGVRWLSKPHATRFHPLVQRLIPDVDLQVVAGLLELAVHWLSPAFRGATLVWSLHRPADRLSGLDPQAAVPAPRLTVTDRVLFPALFSLHGQTDGATLVDPDGTCHGYGTTLVPGPDAIRTVPPHKGTRHTSARRFSYDHPGTLVLVVSEDGPVSVFLDGARIVLVSSDPSSEAADDTPAGPHGPEHRLRCANCRRTLLVELPATQPARRSPPAPLECPVCGHPTSPARADATAIGVDTDTDRRLDDRPEISRRS